MTRRNGVTGTAAGGSGWSGGRRDAAGGLLATFRLLSDGEDMHDVGPAVLTRACTALAAEEGALLLVDAGPAQDSGDQGAGPAARPVAHHGRGGPRGELGHRPGDDRIAADAGRSGTLSVTTGGGAEAWSPMLVEGRLVGLVAFRRPRPFEPGELAAIEVLATGSALGVDRLRFYELWSAKLAQADAAHAQLLRYADDLRTTYAGERRKAEQVAEALDALHQAYAATVHALASAVAEKDDVTGGHLARVSAYGVEAAGQFDAGLAGTPGLEYAFLLHDVGKIGIPDAVLRKPGPLTDDEWVLMREHPAIGLRILDGVPELGVIREVVGGHHERWDGEGYPHGLAGDSIPPAAQLFSTVDAFDAMTSDRPYRAALSVDEALARLGKGAGTQFAPDAVRAFLAVDRDVIDQIRTTTPVRPATWLAGPARYRGDRAGAPASHA
jgi:HD domain